MKPWGWKKEYSRLKLSYDLLKLDHKHLNDAYERLDARLNKASFGQRLRFLLTGTFF